MQEFFKSFFSGLGTAIIIFVLGLLMGGGAGTAIGYKISVNKQKAKASRNSTVIQIGGAKGE